MLRLGQRAWNNILIFAMLFMVYLFTVSNDLLYDNASETSSMYLLPPYSVIMKIQFADVAIERIGQDWRINRSDMEASDLVAIVQRWEALEVTPINTQPQGSPYVIVMNLAGEESPRVIELFAGDKQALLRFQGNTFETMQWDYQELVPSH